MDEVQTDPGRDADEGRSGRERFRDTWDSLSDEARFDRAYQLLQSESGATRKIGELLAKTQTLEEKADSGKLTEQAQLLIQAKARLDLQSRLIQRAAAGEIPPAIAIEFANSDDPDQLFDRVEQLIEERVQDGIGKKLGTKGPLGNYPHDFQPDVSHMSVKEISHLPKGVLDRLMGV